MSTSVPDLTVVVGSSDLPDALPDTVPDVALLRWPEDEPLRRQLAAERLPRLLLVAADQMPPVAGDELEDWIRFPLDPDDLRARTSTLQARARRIVARPFSVTLDDDDVAHADDRWVALPPLEARALARLLERPGVTVARRVLVQACWPGRPPASERSLDGVVQRLRRRVAPLGLRIHTVPRTGFLLDHVPGHLTDHLADDLADHGADAEPDHRPDVVLDLVPDLVVDLVDEVPDELPAWDQPPVS